MALNCHHTYSAYLAATDDGSVVGVQETTAFVNLPFQNLEEF